MRPIWTRSARPTSALVDVGWGLRALGDADRDQVWDILSQRPVENLFVASRVATLGVDPIRLGCTIWGYERDGELVALCHAGSNVVPINTDAESRAAFVQQLGRRRNTAAIMGDAEQVRPFWEGLAERWGDSWAKVRETRFRQPLMIIDHPPQVPVSPSVQRVTMAHFDAYFEAAVAMYTEEVGISPLDASGGYRRYVRGLIERGRAFASIDAQGRVLFKSDVGAAAGRYCQVQGVWLHPSLRGQHLSASAMAAVVNLCHETWPIVSLYVNDYNTRARRLYERVGFRTLSDLATVLY